MRAKTPWILSGLLAIALAVATAFAIWPAVGDAPWEQKVIPTRTAVPTPAVQATAQPKYTADEVIGLIRQSSRRGNEAPGNIRNAGEEADWNCQVAVAIVGSGYVAYAEFQAQYLGDGRWRVDASCKFAPRGGGVVSPLEAGGQPLGVGTWSLLESSREVIPIPVQ